MKTLKKAISMLIGFVIITYILNACIDFSNNVSSLSNSTEIIFDISGKQIIDNDDFSVEYIGKRKDKYLFVAKSKIDDYINLTMDNISVNDYTVSGYDLDLIHVYLLGNTEVLLELEPDSEFLETNQIDNINSISFSIQYRIHDDYDTETNTDTVELTEL